MIYIQGVRSPYAYFGTRQKPRENGVFGVFIGQIGSSWGQNIILIKIREEITVKEACIHAYVCVYTCTVRIHVCTRVYALYACIYTHMCVYTCI